MPRFIWAHLRGRAARSLALLAGILVATAGFTVLTSATDTARLRVTGAVNDNARAAYDILVRPKGARLPMEEQRAQVRPNYLSGLFGGLTLEQYERVRSVPGVQVAAPIAMLGYANATILHRFDITDLVDPRAGRQLIRVDPTFLADRGLSRASGSPSYVYLTRDRVSWPTADGQGFSNGEKPAAASLCKGDPAVLEIDRSGRRTPICTALGLGRLTELGTDRDVSNLIVVRRTPDGRFEDSIDPASARLVVTVQQHVPVLLVLVVRAVPGKCGQCRRP